MNFVATIGGRAEHVEVTGGEGRYRVTIDGRVWEVDARLTPQGIYSLLIEGASHVADITEEEGTSLVEVGGETYAITVEEETRYIIRTRGGTAGGQASQNLTAPLPGRIAHVAVQPGDLVKAGDTLVVIEAMKMENEFKALGAGTVVEVRVTTGQTVNSGDVLVVIE